MRWWKPEKQSTFKMWRTKVHSALRATRLIAASDGLPFLGATTITLRGVSDKQRAPLATPGPGALFSPEPTSPPDLPRCPPQLLQASGLETQLKPTQHEFHALSGYTAPTVGRLTGWREKLSHGRS